MKRIYLFSIVMLMNVFSYGQVEGHLAIAPIIGYNANGVPSLSIGTAIGHLDGYYSAYGTGLTIEGLIPLKKNEPWGMKFGLRKFCASLEGFGIDLSLDMIRYQLNNDKEWHLSPSIGWTLIGFLNLKYAYSAPLMNAEGINISRHQFTTQIFIPIVVKPWRDIFASKRKDK